MNYRLFAALDIPEDIINSLTGMQKGLDGAGWRPRENFHLTLRFFGDCDGADARDLDAELSQILKAPFSLKLSDCLTTANSVSRKCFLPSLFRYCTQRYVRIYGW